MAPFNDLFDERMKATRQKPGHPCGAWWVVEAKTDLGLRPLIAQDRILAFSNVRFAMSFVDKNARELEGCDLCLKSITWAKMVRWYGGAYSGVAINWMGPRIGFRAGGKCYKLLIHY